MKIEQICKECGKKFLRLLYHPQVVLCSECKSLKKRDCVNCPNSKKVQWDLVCMKTGKVVTNGGSCRG